MILYSYQSGFRQHYSTDTCLSYLTDKVRTGFEKGLLTGMVLIDLQKAFDTIDHGIFLDKMNCPGFSNSTVAWFNSYLTNRSFIVNVGKDYSSPGKLSCGVPQGSILGPLLFLLYVNDMPQAVNSELLLCLSQFQLGTSPRATPGKIFLSERIPTTRVIFLSNSLPRGKK